MWHGGLNHAVVTSATEDEEATRARRTYADLRRDGGFETVVLGSLIENDGRSTVAIEV